MKFSAQSGIAGLLLVSCSAFAANPVTGLYVGMVGGLSYTSNTDSPFPYTTVQQAVNSGFANANATYNPIPPLVSPLPATVTDNIGEIAYSVGGNVGGQLGYRWKKFRFEGELMFNMNQLSSVNYDSYSFKDHTTPDGFRMKGSTYFIAGLFNAYYELYKEGSDANFVPYVGLGIGFAKLNSNMKLYNTYVNNVYAKKSAVAEFTDNSGAPIVQGIIGASYFLDDFTSIGVDFRYLKTNMISSLGASLEVPTFNISFISSLDSAS
ncbi:outer membrane protein [Legionella spiritensis]|uniref:Opacity protein-like surface antigen n=1 Tax=Legionella spiritensis TaxID=452 RepID=A0A0W0YYS1_LEGSP|nr:outer membrane beta-barrel protein [Legionella spiritensis]KTD62045.1 opacity protein-like surface antigen [Legionella spiritensis]SNV34524.1 opacity protein-like surface antigen [Legionella spiritensis]